MENAKSIIDIEVNDDQFKEFTRLFEKYRAALGETPKVWGAASTAEGKAADIVHDMTAALSAHVTLITKAGDARAAQAADDARYQKQRLAFEKSLEAAEKRQNDILAKRQKYIKDIGANLTSMMGKTVSIGLNVAKWGAGIGLAAMGGGLFGMDRLGATATGERSTGRMLGVTAGQLRAWRTDFAQYGDPDSLLAAASNAPTDPMMAARMQRLNVDPRIIREGNTSQIAEQTLRGLTDFFNRNKGPNAQQVWAANDYDKIIDYNHMRQFAGASTEERETMFRRLEDDQRGMGNNDRIMRQWSDFTTQLERAKQQIKATFLDGLSGLTGPMSDLSKAVQGVVHEFMSSGAFASVIKIISQGLNDLADSLRDGTAQKAIKDFIDTLSGWAKNGTLTDDLKTIEAGIHKVASLFGMILPNADTNQENLKSKAATWGGAAAGVYTGSKLGGIFGAPGRIVGGVLGGAIGTVSGGIYAANHSNYIPMRRGQQSEFYNLAVSQGESPAMARFLAGIAWTESHGDTHATSKKGAQGLMQLKPEMAKAFGVKDPYDAAQSMHGAIGLVNELVRHFHGDMVKVTAGYNAGEPAVRNAIKKYGEQHWLDHMPKETQDYVGRVNANIQAGGIKIQVNNNTGGAATVTARQASTL